MFEQESRILVAGNKSLEGRALIKYFRDNGYKNILTEDAYNLDLLSQDAVRLFFKKESPEYVFLCHLKNGGILANIKYPADFIYDNLQIQANIIHSSWEFGIKKILFLGSSCVYPKECHQPIKEEYLFSGKLEETSEAYSVAKLAGIKMCQAYNKQYGLNSIILIPATIYGPGDHFDIKESHVIAALINKFHKAATDDDPEIVIRGTGEVRREFLYLDDIINVCIFLMSTYNSSEIINVGSGKDLTIKELALILKDVTGFRGNIIFDNEKPEGVKQKLLDSSKIKKLGWENWMSIEEGIKRTYLWYKQQIRNN